MQILKSVTAYSVLALTITLFIGCEVDSSVEILDYELKTLKYQSPDCEPERDACLMAELVYSDFNRGDSMAVYLANRIIRNSTLDFLGMGDVEAAVTPELDLAVVDLDSSFQRLKKEFGSATGWQAKLKTYEVYKSDTVLVIATQSMSYFGGAHGQYNTRYFNFDRRSGRLIPLSSFLDLNSFTLDAEASFKSKFVKEGQTYREAGFDFLGEKYLLPANYAFKGDSILLHYNHYEIAPYAAGQFDVAVPIK